MLKTSSIFIVSIFLLLFLLMPVIEAETKVTPDPRKIVIKEYCVNGYAFVIVRDGVGVAISQVSKKLEDTNSVVLPKQCNQETGDAIVNSQRGIRPIFLFFLIMNFLILIGAILFKRYGVIVDNEGSESKDEK